MEISSNDLLTSQRLPCVHEKGPCGPVFQRIVGMAADLAFDLLIEHYDNLTS